jgi:hypothetical protein
MSKIGEVITNEGEVLSPSECATEKEFDYKVLNLLDFESIKSFFIKKTIIEAVKERHKISNGSNGVSVVELGNLFKWADIEDYVKELESKKIVKMRKGINSDLYFVYKK